MPATWSSNGKWRRGPNAEPFAKIVDRAAARSNIPLRKVREIANSVWGELCTLLVEDGQISMPGLTLKLKIKKVRGSERIYGVRRQKIAVDTVFNGRLKKQIKAMTESLNGEDSFMDGLIVAVSEKEANPFYPYYSEERYLEALARKEAAKKARDEQQSSVTQTEEQAEPQEES